MHFSTALSSFRKVTGLEESQWTFQERMNVQSNPLKPWEDEVLNP